MITEFEDYKIIDSNIQFKNGNEYLPAINFGCIGTMDGEGQTSDIVKKCEGVITKKISKVTQMDITITAHSNKVAKRQIYGMTNEKLKEGVFAYGSNSLSKSFIFTAKILDMEGNIKYIAFPNISSSSGLKISVNNDVTEIELENFGFTALADENQYFFYEAYESELKDETVKQNWLTNFNYDLVKATSELPTE